MSDNKIKSREEKWQKRWRDARAFVPKNDNSKQKKYNLMEFPYPSGYSLHVGHMVPFTYLDILSRWNRMQGFDVLYPLGFDAMGVDAERFAAKQGMHPSETVPMVCRAFQQDADNIGLSYNPESVFASSDPDYIKWTQWQFIRLFNAGLAYKAPLPMNWCPNCKIALTNEELEGGTCRYCDGAIEKKTKEQWNLAITKYADRLIDDLALTEHPEQVRTVQENWVGRSYGAEVDFKIAFSAMAEVAIAPPLGGGSAATAAVGVAPDIMTIYTTRIDTIFGATFCVIAPEHKLVAKWLTEGRIENADEVCAYIADANAKDEFERTNANREKTGVRLMGLDAINPFNGAAVPLFISDYVLADYGHGAIMAVPAHDQRDWDFAKKFGLPIIPVLDNGDISEHATEGDGTHINSEFMDGMNKEDAIAAAIKVGADGGFARAAKQYKMRDWGFSRQMYWGEPIPLVHCNCCGWVPVPDDQLPVLQPFMLDYKPTDTGESPLARATDWVNTTCPKCGGAAKRETDTMPGWAGSNWFYLRHLDPKNDKEFCSRDQMDKWVPVDLYVGATEHLTRHLIYARFWYKALYDLGLVPGVEPFKKRVVTGLMMGADGRKMSKSKGNAVPVSEAVMRVGADVVRMTILFIAPFGSDMNWSEETLTGVQRFLKRVESFSDNLTDAPLDSEQEFLVNDLIAKMTQRLENMQFNTAISAMMEFINEMCRGVSHTPQGECNSPLQQFPRRAYEILIQVLNPFAPHLTEEMWEKLGHADMLVFEPWPVADESKLVKASVTVAVSVNGKHRGAVDVPTSASQDEIIALAKPVAEKYLIGEIVKTIVVPGRMVNFVIKGQNN